MPTEPAVLEPDLGIAEAALISIALCHNTALFFSGPLAQPVTLKTEKIF
jgi:hypothetical protein